MPIKLSVLKLCLRDDFETNTFRIRLLINHAFLFKVYNATDSLKETTAVYSFLGLNENFTELKNGDKSLFLRR